MSRARRHFARPSLFWLLLTGAACSGEGPGYSNEPPCEEPRHVAFDSLPNGPPIGVEVDGVVITRIGGEAEIARDDGAAMLVLFGGSVSFVPDCVFDEAHIVYDDPLGSLTFSMLASPYGGEPFLTRSSSSISSVPEDRWTASDLSRGEDDPPIARFDVSGGLGGGSGASGVALVELTLLTR